MKIKYNYKEKIKNKEYIYEKNYKSKINFIIKKIIYHNPNSKIKKKDKIIKKILKIKLIFSNTI